MHFIQRFGVHSTFTAQQEGEHYKLCSVYCTCVSLCVGLFVRVICTVVFGLSFLLLLSISPAVVVWRRMLGRDPDQRSISISECRPDTGSIWCYPQNGTHAIDLWPWAISKLGSASLRAGANPCCVYHTTGTTAGWSVCSLCWTSRGLIHMEAVWGDVPSFGFPPMSFKESLVHAQ